MYMYVCKDFDFIYIDFSKVNHNLLILLNRIKMYLVNRKQCVKFRHTQSNSIALLLSGVAQGSHLLPLLFTLFINDLPSVIRISNTLMYADDVKIYLSFNNIEDQVLIQDDIYYLTFWFNTNLMELNVKKI